MWVQFIFFLATVLSSLTGESYVGHKLVRFTAFTDKQAEILDEIKADVWGTSEDLHVALVLLNPEQFRLVEGSQKIFSNYTVVHEDYNLAIDAESSRIAQAAIASKNQSSALYWFGDYHKYEEIKNWFASLERNDQNGIIKLHKSIGKSHEGRDIFAVHITEPSLGRKIIKPKIWVQCLIHSREWISGSVCQYLAYVLNSEYSLGNPRVLSLLREAEIVIIPVVNPDGYAYTWTGNRLWRKNRKGPGTDLNRNFDDHWGVSGGSRSPASEIFVGPSANSEPETKAIQGYFSYLNRDKGVVAAIDFHSFSQLLLRPAGWSSKPSPHEEFLKYASNFMAQDMRAAGSNRQYQVKRSSEFYLNSGSATDWFYEQGAKYSMTVELPPSLDLGDSTGFLLPAKDILDVCREAYTGFLTFADFALHNPL